MLDDFLLTGAHHIQQVPLLLFSPLPLEHPESASGFENWESETNLKKTCSSSKHIICKFKKTYGKF